MRAAVVVGFLNTMGGSEKLGLELVRLLHDLDYTVDVVTLVPTDRSRLRLWTDFNFGELVDNEIVVFPHRMLPTIYSSYLSWLLRDLLIVPFIRNRYDLTITTLQIMPITMTDVVYLHSIDAWVLHPDNISYKKYGSTKFLFAYSRAYWALAGILMKVFNLMETKPIVITNSGFSKSMIERYLKVKPHVIYPPVDVDTYQACSKSEDRGELVLTISRYDEGKDLERIVDIAERVRVKSEFVILGSAHTSHGMDNVGRIRKRIVESGVSDRICLVVNASDSEKMRWLSKAKVLLHPTRGEHFGIAVVEGMASGLVPLVHRSGGAWTDILECGKYGFGYSNNAEAASIIERVLTKQEIYEEFKNLATYRSKRFSRYQFRESFKNIIVALQTRKKETERRAFK